MLKILNRILLILEILNFPLIANSQNDTIRLDDDSYIVYDLKSGKGFWFVSEKKPVRYVEFIDKTKIKVEKIDTILDILDKYYALLIKDKLILDGEYTRINNITGRVIFQFTYDKGIITGEFNSFKDGILVGNQKYENNKKNGDYIYYYPNGKVKEKGKYLNDLYFGEVSCYYENGNLKMKGQFENKFNTVLYNDKTFEIFIVDNSGDTIDFIEPSLKRDSILDVRKINCVYPSIVQIKSGKWYYYDVTGKLIKEEFYKDGEIINK